MRASICLHPDGHVRVTAAMYQDTPQLKGMVFLDLADGCGGMLTLHSQTPEDLIRLGEQIKAEGIRLANERDEKLPSPSWTTDEILQHAG